MRLARTLLVAALALGSLGAPAVIEAQKVRPTTTGPDADGDGVADAQDRCPNTPRGTRVTRFGCALELLRPGQRPVVDSAPAREAGAARPTGLPTAPGQGAAPPPAVTPQSNAAGPAGRSAASGAAAPPSTFTAGLALEPPGDEPVEYLRRFATGLDSAVVTLIGVFRNTTGQPLAGASDPTALSARERDRWTRCRDLHWDLRSYTTGLQAGMPDLEASPALAAAAAELDSALAAIEATTECDNIASMIRAPDRWTPWGPQYTTAARTFYADWYGQVRGAHDKLRAFVIAYNATAPAAARLRVPPGLQRNPPYAGGGVR